MQLGPEAVLAVGLEAEPVAFGDEGGRGVGEGFHFTDDVAVDVFFPVGDVVKEEHGRGGWCGIDDRITNELIDHVDVAVVGGFVGRDRADGGDVDVSGDHGYAAVLFSCKFKQAVNESHSFFFVRAAGPVVSKVVFQILRAGDEPQSGLDPLE